MIKLRSEFKYILSILRELPLLDGEWRIVPEELSNKFAYYKLSDGRNYFFYHSENLQPYLSIREVEQILEKIENKYEPKNTYVVFFSAIGEDFEKFRKTIIEIEENEFLFKKYVCLYTKEEVEYLRKKFKNIKWGDHFWENDSFVNFNKDLAAKLLLRLSIKIPAIKLDFSEIIFHSIENRVSESIERNVEMQDELNKLNIQLDEWLNDSLDEEMVINQMYNSIVGDSYEF